MPAQETYYLKSAFWFTVKTETSGLDHLTDNHGIICKVTTTIVMEILHFKVVMEI